MCYGVVSDHLFRVGEGIERAQLVYLKTCCRIERYSKKILQNKKHTVKSNLKSNVHVVVERHRIMATIQSKHIQKHSS